MERVSGGFDFSARDLLVAVIDKLQVALHDGGVALWALESWHSLQVALAFSIN